MFFDVTSTRTLLDKVVQANRQLETDYEELQSTNDELHTINDALRERGIELDEATSFFDSLVGSIQFGLIVVGRQMRVIVWNRSCEELWGLRSDETVGNVLTALDIGLPTDHIKPLIGQAFVGPDVTGETAVEAVTRRGKPRPRPPALLGVPCRRRCGERRPAVDEFSPERRRAPDGG